MFENRVFPANESLVEIIDDVTVVKTNAINLYNNGNSGDASTV